MGSSRGPGFYEFLIEAELQQYYAGFKNDLKIQNVPQLKYVTEEDLQSIGMSKPEMRRLKKYFQKHYPQTYLSKFKKLILSKREEATDPILSIHNEPQEKPTVKVPNKHIISADAIVVNKELGQGEFGVVQQGVWTDEDDRIQVAIKCLSRERMQNNPIEFLKEAAIMHGIDHEHIVRLYGVVLDTDSLMLVTELAPLRSLLECLKEPSLRSSFPVLSLCHFAIQVCDGMQYLEQKRLIHRDLAARNILVFSKNKVKISDFGLSRALGVGKDYYQTNFNVNLKLPIAWCAPECISYLRFTSASDIWAYGVTLWEMFSYGFQPWAALTGHQILEAIDEPNYQRLEQPECCPREYYGLMLKCWQHDPNRRPRFSDLMDLLPECKPEQVQAVQEFTEDTTKPKRDQLMYRIGDIITVLDKQQQNNCWKGVLTNGKTGLFSPAHTVAYLGNLPSNKVEFQRGDGKNTYSSKRKIRPDMISGPQGDVKHTGHVGLDGAYFGDLSFLGGKNPNLPRQIVTPYKPHEDSSSCDTESNQAGLSRTCSDISDCTPLLTTTHNDNIWAEAVKHEYHEISDEEEMAEKSFDYGPSLLDEMESVFRSLGGSPEPPINERKKPPPPFTLAQGSIMSTPPASPLAEAINVKNELKEMAAKACKKKQATVKPISAADEKTLDCAIAMANELTARSMNDLDGGTPPDSPHTPVSPTKRKFSFRFPSVPKHSSPKPERRNFAEQTACIPDIQSSLSDEAKEVYNSLVEHPVIEAQTLLPTITRITHAPAYTRQVSQPPPPCLTTFGHTQPQQQQQQQDCDAESNPLRMLRSGVFPVVRTRGGTRGNKVPQQQQAESSHQRKESVTSQTSEDDNPIPLPPRDRTRLSLVNKPRHQRKHPLLLPTAGTTGNGFYANCNSDETNDNLKTLPPAHPVSHANIYRPSDHDDSFEQQIATELDALDDIKMEQDFEPVQQNRTRTKPNIHLRNTIKQLNQTALFYSQNNEDEDDGDDDIFETGSNMHNNHDHDDIEFVDSLTHDELRRHDNHVSCEDLVELSNKSRSKSRGTDSDEVRIMLKVLGHDISPEDCLSSLNTTNWEVHWAIKLVKLYNLLKTSGIVKEWEYYWQVLNNYDGDVAKAASVIIAATEGLSAAFV